MTGRPRGIGWTFASERPPMIVARTIPPLAVSLVMAAGMMQPNPAVAAVRCNDRSRACLELAARSYIEGLVTHDGGMIPLAKTVRRTENALTNAKGPGEVRESFARTDMVEAARDVRLFADEKKGEVIALFLLDRHTDGRFFVFENSFVLVFHSSWDF